MIHLLRPFQPLGRSRSISRSPRFIAMLSYQFSSSDPQQWVDQQLSGAHLHDARRNHRAVAIGQAFARHPGKSIPQMFSRKYEIDATYGFFKRPEATPDNLQAGHRRLIRQEASRPGRTFLFLEDTSELSWPGNQPIAGLGPIGSGAQGLQGFLLHSVLGVRWPERAAADETGRRPPVEVLGVADQQYHVRKPRPKGKPKGDARARTRREFESELWDRAGARLGRPPRGVRWVRVAGRGLFGSASRE
jgi:hypothetical protein